MKVKREKIIKLKQDSIQHSHALVYYYSYAKLRLRGETKNDWYSIIFTKTLPKTTIKFPIKPEHCWDNFCASTV